MNDICTRGNSSMRDCPSIRLFFSVGHPAFKNAVFSSMSVGWLFIWCLLATLLQPLVTQANNRVHPTQKPYIINNNRYYPLPSSSGYVETGIASWYGSDFHGRQTSNGEIYNMYDVTAAHKVLPMNTMLLVKNLENGLETVVRVNDRGPFIKGRVVDLSLKAARQLKIVGSGTAKVQIVALGVYDRKTGTTQFHKDAPNFDEGEFYVQIGAFSVRNNALRLQKRFTDAGHTTVIQKFFAPQAVFYRVQVYTGKSLQMARRAEEALLEHGYKNAFVIAR